MSHDSVERRTADSSRRWTRVVAIWLVLAPNVLALAADNVPTYRWKPVTLKAPFAARDGAGALVYVQVRDWRTAIPHIAQSLQNAAFYGF